MSPDVDKGPSRPSYSLLKTVVVILAVAALALAGIWLEARGRATGSGEIFREYRLLMDTGVEIWLTAENRAAAGQIAGQVFDEMTRLESRFSRSLPGSEISHLNEQAGRGPVAVSPETIDLLEQALRYSALSGGAFDPTIAPLLDRWGFLGEEYRVPAESEIKALLPLVDYTRVVSDRFRQEVSLLQEGVSLDLGGIAKGYIVDRGVEQLRRAGVDHGFIDAGGDIGIVGPRPEGKPWRIGIRDPREEEKLVAVIPLSAGAIATSGDYQRGFKVGGRLYHHILDPATGYPADRLLSTTIIAPTAAEADALATAVFVLGPEEGLALVESLPGVEAVLVTPDREVVVSSGLRGKVEQAGS